MHGLALLSWVALAGGSLADPPRCDQPGAPWGDVGSGWDLALRHAPILSFASGERYFPTIPFFTAFDGTDQFGPGTDFADPEEIAPGAKKAGDPTIWTALDRAYRPPAIGAADHGRTEIGLDRAVVFYRICRLTTGQSQAIRRYLLSDEQAWVRFNDDLPLDDVMGSADGWRFDLIQYFLYYLRDAGLQGHPHDVELVSVFVGTSAAKNQFRIVVGSGHTSRTPNNVLVLSALHRGIRALPDTLHALVELGGHSSSPDMPPYGSYTPGVDVNWHIYDVWGTRDNQAVGGTGYLGKYRPEMTFPRAEDAVTLFPPNYGLAERVEGERAMKQTVVTGAPTPHRYRLLPVGLLQDLDTLLADTTTALDRLAAAVTAIQDELCERRWRAAGEAEGCRGGEDSTWNARRFVSLGVDTQRTAAIAMRSWRAGSFRDTTYHRQAVRHRAEPGLSPTVERLPRGDRPFQPPSKHRIWDHSSFRSEVTEVFKAHLFRPTIHAFRNPFEHPGDLTRLGLLGFKGVPGHAYGAYAGFVVPAFRTEAIPVRFGGYMEVHLGYLHSFRRERGSFDFGLLFEGHRNAYVSWFVSGAWTPHRQRLLGDPEAGEFTVGGGLSLLPWLSSHSGRLLNAWRIRIGPRIDPFRGPDLLGRVRWEIQTAIRQ